VSDMQLTRPFVRRMRGAVRLTALAAALSAATAAYARPKIVPLTLLDTGDAPSAFMAQRGGGGGGGRGISLAQATAIAQSQFRGRVVRAESVQRGDRVIYEIRILGDDGRVRTVRIDAQTGAFL
jgi:uncharacterized membrane protein YkoI